MLPFLLLSCNSSPKTLKTLFPSLLSVAIHNYASGIQAHADIAPDVITKANDNEEPS
jgi:hypothetical protein